MRGRNAVVLVGLAMSACAAKTRDVRPAPPFAAVVGPVIIAHRGGSLEAPENTLASMRHGLSSGADWLELDVTLSADDAVIVIHDDAVDRTTDGKGDVSSLTLSALQKLDAGRPRWSDEARARMDTLGVVVPDFANRFAHERVPTLDEVLRLPQARVMIELKKSSRPQRLVEKTLAVIAATGAADRVGLASFELELLDEVHRRDPSLPLIGIVEDREMAMRMLDRPLTVLAVSTDLAADALVLAPAGVAIWTWTAYHVEQAAALRDLGVHGIITDAPQAVVRALRAVQPAVISLSE
ncbi:MAG: glycerophosphodiester phosphodiesterase family protein [Myxococcota bacterium]